MDQLSVLLREGTRQAHTMAENVGFVKCFLKGTVERNSYRQLVANFYFIYSALEDALEMHRDHPVLKGLYYPELYRRRAIEADLRYYFGSDWSKLVRPTAAAARYVERIQTVARAEPVLLVSHSYTRYLGDLSGGQVLKEIAQRAMGLSDGLGTAFYEFESIRDAKAFKAAYRAALDELPIDETQAQRIVEEAIEAFRANMRLFEELEGSLIRAIGQMVFNSLTRRRSRAEREVVTASE
ncbi:heme oxygenase (biliverdin-producing) [Gloeobacter kilaueensis]|uniref:heme oxygenase (biliverdin-producing) n=1 Tax=Gloeobacter kilaueensis (strain ATCC BAA-2537 / CCAP 1431/1 / ULC 316 / JS1) TaxID=1183438 RepID=U5QG29_GLOK1|nr:heme oxygenase (biliverdin-producing) [Gloeobacter kilaueensis]AGY57808.1 heme oxygenase [Gloeobacter kilaueensis JS1]